MNVWHDLDPKYITPDKFTAVIEIPEGSKKRSSRWHFRASL